MIDRKTGALKEANGKHIMSRSNLALSCAKVAGYENDIKTYTRLLIERPAGVSKKRLEGAWQVGALARMKA